MSSLLILDSKGFPKSEDFTVEFHRPLGLKRLALQSFSMWNSWNNVGGDNNQFMYFDGVTWTTVTIPEGNYTFKELNDYLSIYFGVEDPPIKLDVRMARQRFVLKLAENYKVDFSPSKLHEILGFEPRVYDQPQTEAKFVANISKGIDNIHIHCDVIEGAQLGQHSSEILYSFTPRHPPGSQIAMEFERPIFFRVKKDYVSKIRMRVTDQNGNAINLNGQLVLYRLLVEYE